MKTAAFITGLVLLCYKFTERTAAQGFIQYECRDRHLWIRVASSEAPRFEAIDGNGVRSINEQLAALCGYTISTFKMDGFTFRASYYSCFTQNQNDEAFTFRFNVIVSDGGGWSSQSVSAVCPGVSWTHRELVCEENYMEVNVNRESSCGGQWGEGGQAWQPSGAQWMASLAWQLMFLQNDGQITCMSIAEAQGQGYSLTVTTQRIVFRSRYKQPHAAVTKVNGIHVETLRVFLYLRQKLVVVLVDMSLVCAVNSAAFDGGRLLWNVPRVLTALNGEGATFKSRGFRVGVGGVLLDKPTAASRGVTVSQQGGQVQIGVPFGAEGGYRKSLVQNNVYKEAYVVFLLYEHLFSLLYEDGGSIDTRHRMFRVLNTPLVCRWPFSLNQTVSDQQQFTVYLGNIPTDVVVQEVRINGQQFLIPEMPGRGFSIRPVVHVNGSRAYELRLPFQDAVVHWMNVGGGVVQYSISITFTLTILPQRESYNHQTVITARVSNTFPPEITAQCLDGGISFSVVRPPQTQSLWEVGIDNEPLTPQLVAQRGYRLQADGQRTTLFVPVFSIGYTYEEINLLNFYATFKLLLRDSRTLEVLTSTSKRCLFRTQDLIVCSPDGTMTVVATPTSTWPVVQPERTSLLDRSCRPKQTDGARVLFEFKLDSCGTRTVVGDWYIVYENEILYDRVLITDGPNFISRDSPFKVTVRCFYPLGAVNRMSVDRLFSSVTPGFGSVRVSETLPDSNNPPGADCSDDAVTALTRPATLPLSGVWPPPNLVPSYFITPQNLRNPQPQQVPSQEDQNFQPLTDTFPSSLPNYDPLASGTQPTNQNTPDLVSKEMSGPSEEYPALIWDSFSRIPEEPLGQLGHLTQTPESVNGVGDSMWHTWDQSTSGQDLHSLALAMPRHLKAKMKRSLQSVVVKPDQQLVQSVAETKSEQESTSFWRNVFQPEEESVMVLPAGLPVGLWTPDQARLSHNTDAVTSRTARHSTPQTARVSNLIQEGL